MPGLRTLPISAPQKDFWEASQCGPVPSTQVFAAEYLEIAGEVDPKRFEQALRAVIKEAQALQTVRFVEAVREVVRVLDDSVAMRWSLPYYDLSGHADGHARALAVMHEHLSLPIELGRGSFFRFALFRIGRERFYWYHGYAHIIVDGYSCSLIAQRVAELYSALDARIPAPKCRFASLEGLREDETLYLESAQFQEDRRYWLARFADRPASTTLAGPALLRERGTLGDLRETRFLSSQQGERLTDLAKRLLHVTVPQLLTALTAVYMHLQTGAEDVVLSITAMARSSSRERRTPTQTANMLPLRLKVEPGTTLDSLCRQANHEMAHLRRHQRYRMGDLHRELVSLKNPQGVFGPEVNIMTFDYDLRFGRYRATSHNLAVGITDDFMVNLTNRRNGHELRLDFDASPQFYAPAAAHRHVENFLSLMEAALRAPSVPVSELKTGVAS